MRNSSLGRLVKIGTGGDENQVSYFITWPYTRLAIFAFGACLCEILLQVLEQTRGILQGIDKTLC
jgi:hypothetical protein